MFQNPTKNRFHHIQITVFDFRHVMRYSPTMETVNEVMGMP